MKNKVGFIDLGKGLFRRYMKSKYVNALSGVGLELIVLPCIEAPEQAKEALKDCCGLLLPGGDDISPSLYGESVHPGCGKINETRDIAEPLYLAEAMNRKLPVLGICRGCQMLNVALGGTLWQDIEEIDSAHVQHMDFTHRRKAVHNVTIDKDSILSKIGLNLSTGVNSMHHQALCSIAPSLKISAVSEDGIVEAVEGTTSDFVLAVQWHPEHLYPHNEAAVQIFKAFAAAVQSQSDRLNK